MRPATTITTMRRVQGDLRGSMTTMTRKAETLPHQCTSFKYLFIHSIYCIVNTLQPTHEICHTQDLYPLYLYPWVCGYGFWRVQVWVALFGPMGYLCHSLIRLSGMSRHFS